MFSAGDTHHKVAGTYYADAGADYHATAGANMLHKAGANADVFAGAILKQHSGGTFHIDAGASLYQKSGSNINLKGAGIIAADATEVYLNSGLAGSAETAAEATLASMARNASPSNRLRTISLPYITPGDDNAFPYASIVPRAPQHEPWGHHENLNPAEFKPSKTDRESPGSLQSVSHPVTADTFRKNTTTATPAGGSGVGLPASGRGTFTEPVRDPLAPTTDRTATSREQASPPGAPLALDQLVGVIEPFTEDETAAYLGAVGQRESNNRYNVVNSIGFAGKYQFGSAALKEAGMLKPTASNRNSAMENSANWTGQYGCNSLQDWLSNVGNCQEFAMITYSNKNYNYLRRNGGIQGNDTKEQIAGMLMGAHLLGAGGMRNWRRGQGGADAYGTTGDEYFALGSASMGGTATA